MWSRGWFRRGGNRRFSPLRPRVIIRASSRSKGQNCLDEERVGIAAELCPRGVNVSGGADGEIAFAIVAVAAFFEEERPAEFLGGVEDGGFVSGGQIGGDRQAGVGEGVFLQELVLDEADGFGRGPERVAEAFERGETIGVHKFIFESDDIHERTKNKQRIGIVPIADDGFGGEIGGGAVVVAFEDDDVAAELDGGLGEHFGELARRR